MAFQFGSTPVTTPVFTFSATTPVNRTRQTAASSSVEDSKVDTTSGNHQLMGKLICPICRDKFKNPKILPCGHSFCAHCVRLVIISPSPSCPECRASVSASSIEKLPTNFSLKTLAESDNSPIEEVSRAYSDCNEHEKKCDKYCKGCQEQVCEDCVKESHTHHDTFPVGVIVAEQKEMIDDVMKELKASEKTLKKIHENIVKRKKTCQTETTELLKQITAAVEETRQCLSEEQDSLKISVKEEKDIILRRIDSIECRCSEISLLLDHTRDLCLSFLKDLTEDNISRISAMKSLALKVANVNKSVENLSNRDRTFYIGLQFQSQVKSTHVGRIQKDLSFIPKVTHMKTQQLPEGKICGLLWPEPSWFVCISCHSAGDDSDFFQCITFKNYHFLKGEFVRKIGVDKPWCTVTPDLGYDNRSILCLSPKQIHMFTFPSADMLGEPGEVVNTVFLKNVMAIAWDEQRRGCYALLDDGHSFKHVDMDGSNSTREVAELPDCVTKMLDTHLLHVNREGNVAICDHGSNVVYFFESIEELAKVISAPPCIPKAVPFCTSHRGTDRRWYVLWKLQSDVGYQLHAYDSWFQHMGMVTSWGLTAQPSKASRKASSGTRSVETNDASLQSPTLPAEFPKVVSFSFQGEYVIIQINRQAFVYYLS